MEAEEEEVKDWKAENSMNWTENKEDADYGSLPVSLPSADGLAHLARRCPGKETQACGLLIHGACDFCVASIDTEQAWA